MKICILSPIYPKNSDKRLGIFVHEQAKYIARLNHEVHVIAKGDVADKEFEVREGVNVHRICLQGKSIISNFVFAVLTLNKLITLNRELDFDVIHSHFVGALTALQGIAAKLLKKPYFITIHGIGMLTENKLNQSLIRFDFWLASKVICVSNYVAKLASKYTTRSKIDVVNNGVDPEKLKLTINKHDFKKKLGLRNEKILLSVAGLVKRKGIDVVIQALPDVIKQYPDLKYFVIGRGAEKNNLYEMAKSRGLLKNIIFIDYVSNEELASFYNLCDVFILMSRTLKKEEGIEGFGIAYIEASYFGKPVIGGKSGGTSDSIVDEVTGFRVEPENNKEIARKILLLLKNDKLRKKLSRAGAYRVKNQFLWSHSAQKLVRIYTSLINL